MADIIRVSGTRQTSPTGATSIQSPGGRLSLESTLTNVTGNLNVDKNLVVKEQITVGPNVTPSEQPPSPVTQVLINKDNTANVANPFGYIYNPADIYGTVQQRNIAALYVPGGVGIEKDLNVGGYIYGRVSQATTSQQLIIPPTELDQTFYLPFTDFLSTVSGSILYGDNVGPEDVPPDPKSGLTYNPFTGKLNVGRVSINKTGAVSTETGSLESNALYVASGIAAIDSITTEKDLAVRGNAWVEENLDVTKNVKVGEDLDVINTATVGIDLFTDYIKTKVNQLTIQPAAGVTEVQGDIRVLGQKPIGTAPVVTNTLYVTEDGNDTNDGRAMDSSRACRTIGGAINSPFYQPGTQILVSPGHYLEDNPLRMKPYTSIRGSDIRTTFIEPINKTQDLFHVDSGCYINYVTFLNGRSGLLEGQYAPGYNRGAYATAFPPLTGDERIDLFHSPYIQNCTNQSGPWLRDGTMFVPNQTVQVPSAVGTGTWAAGTTTIVVSVGTGTITQGMHINAGQQNPGFFNARTLMLANKPFLQEQVVAFVDQTYPTFDYSREKCFRDVGILVENIAYDAAFGGNEKSVESGLAYYDGVVSLIAGQEVQTTAAINYLNSLTQKIIVNTTATDLLSGTGLYSQVINTALTGGSISTASFEQLFGIVTTIINSGTNFAPPVYRSTGPDAAYVSAEILMQANRAFIQEDTINYINNLLWYTSADSSIADSAPYSEVKCRRDTGLIVDSISLDLLYPTPGASQSTFAGVQYWSQNTYTGGFASEKTETLAAIEYLKELVGKVVLNITTATDAILGFTRYSTATQITSFESATNDEVIMLNKEFDIISDIIANGNLGWTDKIIPNGTQKDILSIDNAVSILQANKNYLQEEVVSFVDATFPGFTYGGTPGNRDKCKRDVGYMVDSVCFDILHGGNKQAVQSGLAYYGINDPVIDIEGQSAQTNAAFNRIKEIIPFLLTNTEFTPSRFVKEKQVTDLPAATQFEIDELERYLTTITNIIALGSTVAAPISPISLTASSTSTVRNAYNILRANREFIQDEIINWIDENYHPYSFRYDEAKCYRDVGLIIDAVSQDILLGGNQKSIEAGLAYWTNGYNSVTGQETTTTLAINHVRDLCLDVIANTPVVVQTGTELTQVINPFFQYGGDYMPQQAVARNFNIITTIINDGPIYAPPEYAGGGLFALTGLNGSDVKISPTVQSVSLISTGTYLVGLNTSTIGHGNNATLYFGEVLTFPYRDREVEELSLELTGSTSTWNMRKVDPIGSMGGSLVDGAVISDRSPIQSFVYDAYTQVTQGGRGIHIVNDGYAQLVSVFTIFCSVGVQVDNGGIASIVNSNANFGDICLLAKGYGKRKFTGHIYNPRNKSYPPDPELDQYYPTGFWPNNARVQVFVPDPDDRPHISLVMEVVPPEFVRDVEGNVVPQLNDQGFPGFLNASPTLPFLATGTITITDIDTDGIAIGNNVYIRDQNNSFTGTNGLLYADTGTTVVDLGYRSVTLSRALTSGGFDPEFGINNPDWFTLYFCGNAYYTVLSGEVGQNPIPDPINILTVNTYTGITVNQLPAHIAALQHLNTVTLAVISNTPILPTTGTTIAQTIDPLVTGGSGSTAFINLRFSQILDIIQAANLTAAEAVVPERLRTKRGAIPSGAGSAVTLLEQNTEFIVEEVNSYVKLNNPLLPYNELKCKRDVRIIVQRIIYDLETGGNYNSVMTGLSYWSRPGTYFIVQLGEPVRNSALFPDGATVNFYQRSYISASGYVFEYVGAGIDYGALPQRGIKDPVQGKETVQLGSGKVFFTSTDQNGDFRIGPGLVISQATGVLSGRTFTKSLYAYLTPFILAIEGGG